MIHSVKLFIGGVEVPLSDLNFPQSVSVPEIPPVVVMRLHQYNDMKKRLDKLDALEAGGVDNWSGYGDCFEGDEDE